MSDPISKPLVPESMVGKKVLVMGLGRFGGGVGVSKWLVEQGAVVTVNDASVAGDLAESMAQLDGLPITFKLGGHDVADFLAADLLVINPAVDKEKSPVVQQALQAGIPYTTEMNLFVERCAALTIGVTGSVGKSTTTALIYEALRGGLGEREDCKVHMGGNIGRSLLLDLPHIRPTDIVVLELSSFMLEDTHLANHHQGWSPHIAVVTNVFPNHLDRHNTMDSYAAAKRNILEFQSVSDIAIFNSDHDLVSRWVDFARGKTATFTIRGTNKIPLLIPGEHNQSNAWAALAVIDALPTAFKKKIDLTNMTLAITQFPGLSHRLQHVHSLSLSHRKPLDFFNDSKATSPDASITALQAFAPQSAIFIVGGYDKHIDLSPFEQLLASRAGGIIGIGQTGQAITQNVLCATPAGAPLAAHIAYAETLAAALPLAVKWAQASPQLTSVVLSPASASWGQFKNYEERGDTFIRLARALPTQ